MSHHDFIILGVFMLKQWILLYDDIPDKTISDTHVAEDPAL